MSLVIMACRRLRRRRAVHGSPDKSGSVPRGAALNHSHHSRGVFTNTVNHPSRYNSNVRKTDKMKPVAMIHTTIQLEYFAIHTQNEMMYLKTLTNPDHELRSTHLLWKMFSRMCKYFLQSARKQYYHPVRLVLRRTAPSSHHSGCMCNTFS